MTELGTILLSSRTNGWRNIGICHSREDVTLAFRDGQYQDTPELHRRVADGRPYCDAITCDPNTPGSCPPEAFRRLPKCH